MVNEVKDVDFVIVYKLPNEFVIVVARGLLGGTVTVDGCCT